VPFTDFLRIIFLKGRNSAGKLDLFSTVGSVAGSPTATNTFNDEGGRPMKRATLVLAALTLMLGGVGQAKAEMLIVTTQAVVPGASNALVQVDTTTKKLTTIFFTPQGAGTPDSLIFSGGNILYSLNTSSNDSVHQFNPATHTDTLLHAGYHEARDVTLEPGGKTVLLSNFFGGTIDRIDLNTKTSAPLSALPTGNYDGTAYDAAGHLFAMQNQTNLVQLDPTTGAVLKSIAMTTGDGLTFDPVTGDLFVARIGKGFVTEVTTGLQVVKNIGSNLGPLDGIESDGLGNLFVASYTVGVYKINVAAGMVTDFTSVPGIDDIIPLVGLGAAPEPSTLTLLGLGLAELAGYGWRRRKQAIS
jgi:hypothetical protein